MILAFDFDGTICRDKFPKIGDEYEGAIQTLKDLQDVGHQIIIWTCRTQVEHIVPMILWLNDRGFVPDAVNRNLIEDFNTHPKIYADFYLDNRNFPPFPGWKIVRKFFGLDLLAEGSQNVKPMVDVRALFGTWPGEEDDGFEEMINESRHRNTAGNDEGDEFGKIGGEENGK